MQTEFQIYASAITATILILIVLITYFFYLEKKAKQNLRNCRHEIELVNQNLKMLESNFEIKREIVEKQIQATTNQLKTIGKHNLLVNAESLIQIYGSVWSQ